MTQHRDLRYEYPLTEKTRTLLRMENILREIKYFGQCSNRYELSQVVRGWVSFAQLFERTDVKQELIKDLEREANQLTTLFQVPEVDHQKLNEFLDMIKKAQHGLHSIHDKRSVMPGDFLFKEAFKKSILPGPFNGFDSPFLYQWLQTQPLVSEAPLKSWELSFQPLTQAIEIYLKLLRGHMRFDHVCVERGELTQSLSNHSDVQLVCLTIPSSIIPEMSGSKYQFHARFFKSSVHEQGELVDCPMDIEIGYR